jgi:pimeloyl-ACP methyl ester carboxylesterase
MIAEKVFRFGSTESLLGVLTEGIAKEAKSIAPPAVLLLNAGMVHHVGPFGWYVTLARRLAALGLHTFRIDLSGVGESPNRNDNRPTVERAAQDVAEAMDFLERKKQVERFVLVGVCSGAVIAHLVATRDARVVGVAMFDGYAYRTSGYYIRHYVRRLLRWRSWVGATRGVVAKVWPSLGSQKPAPEYLTAEYFLQFPPQEQTRSELVQLLDRGVRCFYLYTGGMAELHLNHRRQFGEMFGNVKAKKDRLQVEYLPQADHLFSAHTHRQIMFDRVETWMRLFL